MPTRQDEDDSVDVYIHLPTGSANTKSLFVVILLFQAATASM